MQRSLVKLDHAVDVWGLGHENFNTSPDWNLYDAILNLENYDLRDWVPDLSYFVRPKKFLWRIDAHSRGMDPYLKTFHQGNYDLMLQSTEDFVDANSVWFPNCYDHTLVRPSSPKTVFLGFCGSLLDREKLLDSMVTKFGLKKDIWVLGDEMVRTVSFYRIHFNKKISNDINYRSFETIGCGSLLLTNYIVQYEKLGFRDGENCLMYKDIQSLYEKIEKCQLNLELVSTISKNGYELAKPHTYDKRAIYFVSIYNDCIRK